jgi:hypothetical protein
VDFIDPQVIVQGDMHGKVEQTRLVDLNFTNVVEFPHMDTNAFMDCTTLMKLIDM